MSGFDELEASLGPREPVYDNFHGLGEPPRHQPHLQWTQTPLQEALKDFGMLVLAPFRFLARLTRG